MLAGKDQYTVFDERILDNRPRRVVEVCEVDVRDNRAEGGVFGLDGRLRGIPPRDWWNSISASGEINSAFQRPVRRGETPRCCADGKQRALPQVKTAR